MDGTLLFHVELSAIDSFSGIISKISVCYILKFSLEIGIADGNGIFSHSGAVFTNSDTVIGHNICACTNSNGIGHFFFAALRLSPDIRTLADDNVVIGYSALAQSPPHYHLSSITHNYIACSICLTKQGRFLFYCSCYNAGIFQPGFYSIYLVNSCNILKIS